jgi:hypothetical protein
MDEKPEALRLADVPICERSITWQSQATAELRRLHRQELAAQEWLDRTDWVQETAHESELGLHRADVLKQRIEHFRAFNQALLEALERERAVEWTRAYEEGYERGSRNAQLEPRREWQSLTDEEREQATGWSVEHIEAALKERNT